MSTPAVQRKLAAILAADIAGYSRLVGADEEGTIARLRALRCELIDPTVAAHRGRIVKTTGDGILIEFASVVDAVRCAVEVQRGMTAHNTDMPTERRIDFRVGVHLGDIVVEGDDLLGDGVNVAARLEGIAEPGAICLSDDAYRHVKGKIDLAVRDLGLQRLKNIAYAVHAYAIPADGSQMAGPAAAAPEPRAGAIGVVSRAELRAQRRLDRAGTRKQRRGERRRQQDAHAVVQARGLSIVVLPFANLSGDPAQDHLAEGITDDITTDLSRLQGSFVIARSTAYAFKGNKGDVRHIARELGVRYVLEGSVQRDGNALRVNAHLIDGESGRHLWADRFEGNRSNLFALQNQVIGRVANSLRLELSSALGRQAEASRNTSPDALDYVLRARAVRFKPQTRDNFAEMQRLFEEAVKLDARSGEAWAGLADAIMLQALNFPDEQRDENLRRAETAVERALALEQNHSYVRVVKGLILYGQKRLTEAAAEIEAAIARDQNDPYAYYSLGLVQLSLGHPERLPDLVERAMALSPRDPSLAHWQRLMGIAHLHLRADDLALEWLLKSRATNPNLPLTHLMLASAYGLVGQLVDAGASVAEARRLSPIYALRWLEQNPTSNEPRFLRLQQRVWEGLRKAGMPEE